MRKPVVLMILDGFAIAPSSAGNAIAAANTPNLDLMFQTYPNTQLNASGLQVGLPDGLPGNSEVGHLNIGSGRIVYQDLTKISKAIDDGDFFENQILKQAMNLEKDQSLHILGLLSDGGVHSHIKHFYALLDLAKAEGVKQVYFHCFLDGRDVPPKSAFGYIIELESYMKQIGLGKIATISGRYYAMDRDNRWERIEQAYQALSLRSGIEADSAEKAVEMAYARGETDEFVLPTVITDPEITGIQDGDSIIMLNFRADRAREITRCFVDPHLNGFQRKKIYQNLNYVCMTEYDADMPNVSIAFPHQSLVNTLGEYLASLDKRQLRLAETEKYAHVTFFFNGGIEAPYRGEDRILVPSPKVATYDLKPEMSAYQVTEKALEQLKRNVYDVIIMNYANADMVGHTGVFDAAVKAVETLDACAKKIADEVLAQNGTLLITADHGNADKMQDENGNVVTSHSANPVPFLVISNETIKALREGCILADLAPTILALMELPKPKEMTGASIIDLSV